jgi:hypothetical protein
MTQRNRNRALIGFATAVIGALGAAGMAVASASHGRSAPKHVTHRAQSHQTGRVRGHIAAADVAFPVLTRAGTPADALPAEIATGIPASEPADKSASRLVGNVPGGQAWLVPETDGGLCLIVSGTNAANAPSASGSCASGAAATSSGIGVSGPAGAILVLPAGSSAVRFTTSNSSGSVAPSADGLVTIPAPFQSASYTGPDGSAHSIGGRAVAAVAASQ